MRNRWHDTEPQPVPEPAGHAFPALGGHWQLRWPRAESGLRDGADASDGSGARSGAQARSGIQTGSGIQARSGAQARSGTWASDANPRLGASPSARFDWLLDGFDGEQMDAPNALIPNPDGAPAVSMPGLAGRFAAEWCPSGTSSRGSSLLRKRRRTDGG